MLKRLPRLVSVDGEDDALQRARLVRPGLLDHDLRALLEREAADAGAECRQRERPRAELVGEPQAASRRALDEVGARAEVLAHDGAVQHVLSLEPARPG